MKRTILILVSLAMGAAACSSTPPEAATVGTLVATTSTTIPTDPFQRAVAATEKAGRYRFVASVLLRPAAGETIVRLEGWVDGDDRELVTVAGDQRVVTRVIDGLATTAVDDAEAQEIPLTEATAAPSLDVLAAIDVDMETPGRVTGRIPVEALSDLGMDGGQGDALVTVTFDEVITGYRIEDPVQRWTVEVALVDVGRPIGA